LVTVTSDPEVLAESLHMRCFNAELAYYRICCNEPYGNKAECQQSNSKAVANGRVKSSKVFATQNTAF
jgi:hypothetical protein